MNIAIVEGDVTIRVYKSLLNCIKSVFFLIENFVFSEEIEMSSRSNLLASLSRLVASDFVILYTCLCLNKIAMSSAYAMISMFLSRS